MVWIQKDNFINIKYSIYSNINSGYRAFYTYMQSGSDYAKHHRIYDDDDYNDFDD